MGFLGLGPYSIEPRLLVDPTLDQRVGPAAAWSSSSFSMEPLGANLVLTGRRSAGTLPVIIRDRVMLNLSASTGDAGDT